MLRKLLLALCAVAVLCGVALVGAKSLVMRASRGNLYTDAFTIPHRRVALVLGCPKRTPGGWSNPFFENRMAAAAELYHKRKIDFLVVSGDNHTQGYDEPTDMKEALAQRGVPIERIYLDYAGFRTLDSVVRVKEIFLQDKITIVSQRFHNERAIFLARHHGIDAIGFDAPDVVPEYALKTLLREQFARVKAALDVYLFHTKPHFLGRRIAVGYPHAVLDPKEANQLAEMMCAQLPNLGTLNQNLEAEASGAADPRLEPDSNQITRTALYDDTFDALFRLGRYSAPCLVNHLTDTRWMPDPRAEPLLGVPLAGDVAYMVLGQKGVPDLLPGLAHKKQMRMDEYFLWPGFADRRKQLQNAVRAWLHGHPDCCGGSTIDLRAAPAQPILRMRTDQIAASREKFARLRPGMSRGEVRAIVGKPDAVEAGAGVRALFGEGPGEDPDLFGTESDDHNGILGAIYFVERWADEISRRDPLRDRYVILYFSRRGNFLRMFSNIASIPPIFPRNASEWQKLLLGGVANSDKAGDGSPEKWGGS